MSLDGAKFVRLDENGVPQADATILAKGRKFAVGYYASCDYVLEDARVKSVHCEIQCDAFGRVTIHNLCQEHPISVNGEAVGIKRLLLNGARISILDQTFLWEFPKPTSSETENAPLDTKETTTPLKQAIAGSPEQAPNSCPDLRVHREVPKRLTVHNFAYCIQSDEEGNTTIESPDTSCDEQSAQKIEEVNSSSSGSLETKATTGKLLLEQRRSVTPEPQTVPSTSMLQLEVTPKMNLINYTQNKENASTEKKKKLLTLCHQSDVVITSFSPRETGVRIEKSFTAILKPAATPKSVYSTPKSLLLNDDGDSNDFIDFSTPATSKKHLSRLTTKSSSMHLIDFTTPNKLGPTSPYLKSAIKSSAKKKVDKPSGSQKQTNFASVLEEEDEQLGVTALPATPTATPTICNIEKQTPSSVESVISVNSTDTSSVIEISGDDDSPVASTSHLLTKTPSKPPPQSLIKRVLLTSTKKQAATSPATTPRRSVALSSTTPTKSANKPTLGSPITPRSVSNRAAEFAARRQSLSTPTRKSFVASRLKLDNSPSTSLGGPSTSHAAAAAAAARRSSLNPLSGRKLPSSTPLGANSRHGTLPKTSPLHRVRKSVGGISLASHISKTRKSLALPSNRSSPANTSSQAIAKRAMPSATPTKTRSQIATSTTPRNKLKEQQSSAPKEVESKKALPIADKQPLQIIETVDLSCTFTIDSDDETAASSSVGKDIKPKNTTFSPIKDNAITKVELNKTFSPVKDTTETNVELNRTFSPVKQILEVENIESPLDVAEVKPIAEVDVAAVKLVKQMDPSKTTTNLEKDCDQPVSKILTTPCRSPIPNIVVNSPDVITESFAEIIEDSFEVVAEESDTEETDKVPDEKLDSSEIQIIENTPVKTKEHKFENICPENSNGNENHSKIVEKSEAKIAETEENNSEHIKRVAVNLAETSDVIEDVSINTECKDTKVNTTESDIKQNENVSVCLAKSVVPSEDIADCSVVIEDPKIIENPEVANKVTEECEILEINNGNIAEVSNKDESNIRKGENNEDRNAVIELTETNNEKPKVEIETEERAEVIEKPCVTVDDEKSAHISKDIDNPIDECHEASQVIESSYVNIEEQEIKLVISDSDEAETEGDEADKITESTNEALLVQSENIAQTNAISETDDQTECSKEDDEADKTKESNNESLSIQTENIAEANMELKKTNYKPETDDQTKGLKEDNEADKIKESNNESLIVQTENITEENSKPETDDQTKGLSEGDETNTIKEANMELKKTISKPETDVRSDSANAVIAKSVETHQSRNGDNETKFEEPEQTASTSSDIHKPLINKNSSVDNDQINQPKTDGSESEEITALLEEIDDVLNKSDEMQQKLLNKSDECVENTSQNLGNASADTVKSSPEVIKDNMKEKETEIVKIETKTSDENATECNSDMEQTEEINSSKLEVENEKVEITNPDSTVTGKSIETEKNVTEKTLASNEITPSEIVTETSDEKSTESNLVIEQTEEITASRLEVESENVEITNPDSSETPEKSIETEKHVAEKSLASNDETTSIKNTSSEIVTGTSDEKATECNVDIEQTKKIKLEVENEKVGITKPGSTVTEKSNETTSNKNASSDKEIHEAVVEEPIRDQTNNTPKKPNLRGMREMLRTPKEAAEPKTPRFAGLRNLLRTPKASKYNETEDLDGVESLLQTPNDNREPQPSTSKSSAKKVIPTFTPRRSARRASTSAETITTTTPKRANTRRASLSTEATTSMPLTPRRIVTRRLSIDVEVPNNTPQKHATSAKRVTCFEEHVEDMGAIVEEELITDDCDKMEIAKTKDDKYANEVDNVSTVENVDDESENKTEAGDNKNVIVENICEVIKITEEEDVEAIVSDEKQTKQLNLDAEEKIKDSQKFVVQEAQSEDKFEDIADDSLCEIIEDSFEAPISSTKASTLTNKDERVVKIIESEELTSAKNDKSVKILDEFVESDLDDKEESVEILDESEYDYGNVVADSKATGTVKSESTALKLEPTTPKPSKLLKRDASTPKTPLMVGMRELLKTPGTATKTPKFFGLRELVRTPQAVCSTPLLGGVKELLDTPTAETHISRVAALTFSEAEADDMNDANNTDKFFTTPRAKNIMIPTLPASAVIEKNSDSVELVHSTEYDLNDTNAGTTNLEDIFKTPVASRFAERIADSMNDDDDDAADEDEEIVDTTATTSKAAALEVDNEQRNLSAEEAFDQLIGEPTAIHTPARKVYARKSLAAPIQQSPFSAADVISDLPKTDIQEWVDSLEEAEIPNEEDVELNESLKVAVIDEQEVTMNDELVEGIERDPLSSSLALAKNSSSTRLADSCTKIFIPAGVANTTTASEIMLNVSTVSSLPDPLHSTALKTIAASASNVPDLSAVDENSREAPFASVASDISGINLLDQTEDSVHEALLVSDDTDSLDKTLEESSTNIKQNITSNSKNSDDSTANNTIDPSNIDKDNELIEALVVSDTDSLNTSKEEEISINKPKSNLNETIKKECNTNSILIADDEEEFPELVVSDSDSTTETAENTKTTLKIEEVESNVADNDEIENEFPSSSIKEEIAEDFKNFDENPVLREPISKTPIQIKASSTLQRKTLGVQEDKKITIDFKMEKEKIMLKEEFLEHAETTQKDISDINDYKDVKKEDSSNIKSESIKTANTKMVETITELSETLSPNTATEPTIQIDLEKSNHETDVGSEDISTHHKEISENQKTQLKEKFISTDNVNIQPTVSENTKKENNKLENIVTAELAEVASNVEPIINTSTELCIEIESESAKIVEETDYNDTTETTAAASKEDKSNNSQNTKSVEETNKSRTAPIEDETAANIKETVSEVIDEKLLKEHSSAEKLSVAQNIILSAETSKNTIVENVEISNTHAKEPLTNTQTEVELTSKSVKAADSTQKSSVKLRTRKGSQSSQCSTSEINSPKRRVHKKMEAVLQEDINDKLIEKSTESKKSAEESNISEQIPQKRPRRKPTKSESSESSLVSIDEPSKRKEKRRNQNTPAESIEEESLTAEQQADQNSVGEMIVEAPSDQATTSNEGSAEVASCKIQLAESISGESSAMAKNDEENKSVKSTVEMQVDSDQVAETSKAVTDRQDEETSKISDMTTKEPSTNIPTKLPEKVETDSDASQQPNVSESIKQNKIVSTEQQEISDEDPVAIDENQIVESTLEMQVDSDKINETSITVDDQQDTNSEKAQTVQLSNKIQTDSDEQPAVVSSGQCAQEATDDTMITETLIVKTISTPKNDEHNDKNQTVEKITDTSVAAADHQDEMSPNIVDTITEESPTTIEAQLSETVQTDSDPTQQPTISESNQEIPREDLIVTDENQTAESTSKTQVDSDEITETSVIVPIQQDEESAEISEEPKTTVKAKLLEAVQPDSDASQQPNISESSQHPQEISGEDLVAIDEDQTEERTLKSQIDGDEITEISVTVADHQDEKSANISKGPQRTVQAKFSEKVQTDTDASEQPNISESSQQSQEISGEDLVAIDEDPITIPNIDKNVDKNQPVQSTLKMQVDNISKTSEPVVDQPDEKSEETPTTVPAKLSEFKVQPDSNASQQPNISESSQSSLIDGEEHSERSIKQKDQKLITEQHLVSSGESSDDVQVIETRAEETISMPSNENQPEECTLEIQVNSDEITETSVAVADADQQDKISEKPSTNIQAKCSEKDSDAKELPNVSKSSQNSLVDGEEHSKHISKRKVLKLPAENISKETTVVEQNIEEISAKLELESIQKSDLPMLPTTTEQIVLTEKHTKEQLTTTVAVESTIDHIKQVSEKRITRKKTMSESSQDEEPSKRLVRHKNQNKLSENIIHEETDADVDLKPTTHAKDEVTTTVVDESTIDQTKQVPQKRGRRKQTVSESSQSSLLGDEESSKRLIKQSNKNTLAENIIHEESDVGLTLTTHAKEEATQTVVDESTTDHTKKVSQKRGRRKKTVSESSQSSLTGDAEASERVVKHRNQNTLAESIIHEETETTEPAVQNITEDKPEILQNAEIIEKEHTITQHTETVAEQSTTAVDESAADPTKQSSLPCDESSKDLEIHENQNTPSENLVDDPTKVDEISESCSDDIKTSKIDMKQLADENEKLDEKISEEPIEKNIKETNILEEDTSANCASADISEDIEPLTEEPRISVLTDEYRSKNISATYIVQMHSECDEIAQSSTAISESTKKSPTVQSKSEVVTNSEESQGPQKKRRKPHVAESGQRKNRRRNQDTHAENVVDEETDVSEEKLTNIDTEDLQDVETVAKETTTKRNEFVTEPHGPVAESQEPIAEPFEPVVEPQETATEPYETVTEPHEPVVEPHEPQEPVVEPPASVVEETKTYPTKQVPQIKSRRKQTVSESSQSSLTAEGESSKRTGRRRKRDTPVLNVQHEETSDVEIAEVIEESIAVKHTEASSTADVAIDIPVIPKSEPEETSTVQLDHENKTTINEEKLSEVVTNKTKPAPQRRARRKKDEHIEEAIISTSEDNIEPIKAETAVTNVKIEETDAVTKPTTTRRGGRRALEAHKETPTAVAKRRVGGRGKKAQTVQHDSSATLEDEVKFEHESEELASTSAASNESADLITKLEIETTEDEALHAQSTKKTTTKPKAAAPKRGGLRKKVEQLEADNEANTTAELKDDEPESTSSAASNKSKDLIPKLEIETTEDEAHHSSNEESTTKTKAAAPKRAGGRKKVAQVVIAEAKTTLEHKDEDVNETEDSVPKKVVATPKPRTAAVVATPRRTTRKASALDVDRQLQQQQPVEDVIAAVSTTPLPTTESPKRERTTPRRAVAAHAHNYDESSDTETATTSARKTAATTTSRGRTRKPTARVQQYLEEELAKAETPSKRRLLATVAVAAAVAESPIVLETPTATPKRMPARRGRKPSTIETSSSTVVVGVESPPHAVTAKAPAQRGVRARAASVVIDTVAAEQPPTHSSAEDTHSSHAEDVDLPVPAPAKGGRKRVARKATTTTKNAAAAADDEEEQLPSRKKSPALLAAEKEAAEKEAAEKDAVEKKAAEEKVAEVTPDEEKAVVEKTAVKETAATIETATPQRAGRRNAKAPATIAAASSVESDTPIAVEPTKRGRGTRRVAAKTTRYVEDSAVVDAHSSEVEEEKPKSSTARGGRFKAKASTAEAASSADKASSGEVIVLDDEEDAPLAQVAATKRIAPKATTDSPATKRTRRKIVEEVETAALSTADLPAPPSSSTRTVRRGRNVRFETTPDTSSTSTAASAAAAAAVVSADETEKEVVVVAEVAAAAAPADAVAVAPPPAKRATRTRRK